jgi:uncharacterized protein (TIGR02588 family)
MPRGRREPTPALEWIAAASGVVVILVAIGIILYEAVSVATPANLATEVTASYDGLAGRIVEFRVWNAGSETAADVRVAGSMGETVSETTFDFVPGSSERTGMLVFPEGTADDLSIRIVGYTDP